MYFVVLKQFGFFDHLPLVLPRGDDVITGTLQCGVFFFLFMKIKQMYKQNSLYVEKIKTSKTQLQIQGRHDHALYH